MNLTEQEIKDLKSAKTPEDWEVVIEDVKSKRNGNLPTDWAEKIIAGDFVNPKMRDGISIW